MTPELAAVRYGTVPDLVKRFDQWINWREEPNPNPEKKPLKVPYQPDHPFRKASTTRPREWSTFAQAVAQANDERGIGLVLAKAPILFADLDGVISHTQSTEGSPLELLAASAENFIRRMATWTERSPSRKGLHVVPSHDLSDETLLQIDPRGGGHFVWHDPETEEDLEIELYWGGGSDRYMTVTGDCVAWPGVIAERDDQIIQILRESRPKTKPPANNEPGPPLTDDDSKLMDELFTLIGVKPRANQQCPFHDGASGTSFSYKPGVGWKCFSECGKGAKLGILLKRLCQLNDEAAAAVARRKGVPLEKVLEARARARTESAKRRDGGDFGEIADAYQAALGPPPQRPCGLSVVTNPEGEIRVRWAMCGDWSCLWCGGLRRAQWEIDLAPKLNKVPELYCDPIPEGQWTDALKKKIKRSGATYRWWRTTTAVGCREVLSTSPLTPNAALVEGDGRRKLLREILKTIRRPIKKRIRGPGLKDRWRGEHLHGGSRAWKPPAPPKGKGDQFIGVSSRSPAQMEAFAKKKGIAFQRSATITGPDKNVHPSDVRVAVPTTQHIDVVAAFLMIHSGEEYNQLRRAGLDPDEWTLQRLLGGA
jgi:hypothetical protein